MDLYLAGGLHADPICRPKFVAWLGTLVKQLGPPAFVAVEVDENVKAVLKMKRSTFIRLAGGLWDNSVDLVVAAALAETMAWELDAHREVLSDLEPIFLDEQGSRADAIDPLLHFNLMAKYLSGFAGDRRSPADVTTHISQQAQFAAEATGVKQLQDPEYRKKQADREAGWVKKLRMDLLKPGWGVCVTGALHASRFDGQTFRSLVAGGPARVANVEYLTWRPPQQIA